MKLPVQLLVTLLACAACRNGQQTTGGQSGGPAVDESHARGAVGSGGRAVLGPTAKPKGTDAGPRETEEREEGEQELNELDE
jgi:hypothetical protein